MAVKEPIRNDEADVQLRWTEQEIRALVELSQQEPPKPPHALVRAISRAAEVFTR